MRVLPASTRVLRKTFQSEVNDEANRMCGKHGGNDGTTCRGPDSGLRDHQGGHGYTPQGRQRPLAKLKKALKAESPDWSDVQKLTKDFEKYGAFLEKNDPPRGEKADFEKLAKAYYKNAKRWTTPPRRRTRTRHNPL